jgi:exopolysaccharide biosynthesis polyprenyl glycosylphosphotransferase
MSLLGKRRGSLLLLVGDFFFFLFALWLALFIRHLSLPSGAFFLAHVGPFIFLFLVWIIVFYIAGLYEKHTTILQSKLPSLLFNVQVINSFLAVAFFYLLPFLGITPKTLLFIYLVVSFVVIFVWRRYGFLLLSKGRHTNAVIIGSGSEMKELFKEINSNPIYNIHFISSVDLDRTDGGLVWDEIISRIYAEDVSLIVIDLANEKIDPVLPHLYNLIFSGISFIEMHKVYEDTFDRVPLSLLRYNWFMENISSTPREAYDALKRLMDIALAFSLSVIAIPFYLLAMLSIKLDDAGPIFITQDRVGKNNRNVRIFKFRSMTKNDDGRYGTAGTSTLKVTKAGAFLRKTRIDELPQLWNVLRGDLSLIGPRPELPTLVKHYTDEVSYYNVRHLIKPGLSGWAQIYHDNHPHHGVDTAETKNKLSYDLYYIKNRSLLLDLKIALKTLKTLMSIAGR